MVKIIALDLDGTLLDSNKHLSERNRAALERAASKGALIVPTTGRFFGMMPDEIKNLPFVRYAITINGAQVYDHQLDKAIIREEIPVSTAVEIMKVLDRYDIIYDCYRANWGWMTKSLQEKSEPYATDEHYLKMIKEFRHPVPELKDHLLSTPEDGDIQKIMLFAKKDDKTKALGLLKEIGEEIRRAFPEIKATSSTWNDLEFNIASAHKGNSLKRFAEHLGCTIDECAAFGDGMNDLTMIQSAGYGVAMGNAVAEVINAAKIRTLTNDEDGVAAVLESWF